MALYSTDSDLSEIDDEIFFGKLTLKEAKKHIFLGERRQTIAYTTNQHEAENDTSIKIIETHSAPDIPTIHIDPPAPIEKSISNPNISPNQPSKWEYSVSDESFLLMEKLVMELCMSPRREKLESNIDIDLPENETVCSDKTADCIAEKQEKFEVETVNIQDVESYKTTENETICNDNTSDCISEKQLYKTPAKETNPLPKTPHSAYQTPKTNHHDIFTTPSTGIKTFKTPGNPIQKKTSVKSLKKPFQHVTSPVAFYINSCPIVPSVKGVRPQRLLPGTSSIPKLIKSTSKTNICNKENVKLQSGAYRSAKQTKVINKPDENKLPKSHLAKQVISSIPKAVVLKHDHRETTTKKSLFHHKEDSFGNLSVHQAEVSVCTLKSAFKKPK